MFSKDFYPTPKEIIKLMISKLENKDARYFLEPSAGKGDIADYIKQLRHYNIVDCIEQSPELVSVLSDKNHQIVGYDFLEYDGICYYDAIIMNPPFSNGDEHLLKAWDFVVNGEIVCLLNAETIKNPYSKNRKILKNIIEEHGYYEILGNVFKEAERKTEVEVALVYLSKKAEDDSLDIWAERNITNEKQFSVNDIQENSVALRDRLGNMQHFYDKANYHMIESFKHIRKAQQYMSGNNISMIYEKKDIGDIMSMALNNVNAAKAEWCRKHRNIAWKEVFTQTEFDNLLDKKQKQQFLADVEKHSNIPFTKENIKGTLQNLYANRNEIFKKSVANMFDTLTKFYPGNTDYKEGWKSNKNYKVNKKIVFPYGCSFDGWWSHRYYGTMDIYTDLDKILSVISGKRNTNSHIKTVDAALREQFEKLNHKQTDEKFCESEFFHIKFYKKGTVHLTFKDDFLLEQFNILASEGKNELYHDKSK